MLRSMYSGISGLKNFQTKLDVVANNIANVNTYGFKKGRVTFKDAISQTIATAAAGEAGSRGGTNPIQVGLGSEIASIDTVHTEGSLQTTGRILDLAISGGDGYFVVTDGQQEFYTRSGNFYLDNEGYLVNADGYRVLQYNSLDDENPLGDPIRIPIEEDIAGFSISPTGALVIQNEDGELRDPIYIALARFNNAEGLNKVGSNLFAESENSGDAIFGTGGGAFGSINSGKLEMSNVDLTEEFTEMIVAQRAFQANARIITTSDEILQELVNLKR